MVIKWNLPFNRMADSEQLPVPVLFLFFGGGDVEEEGALLDALFFQFFLGVWELDHDYGGTVKRVLFTTDAVVASPDCGI